MEAPRKHLYSHNNFCTLFLLCVRYEKSRSFEKINAYHLNLISKSNFEKIAS